jgi:hypothetical protein
MSLIELAKSHPLPTTMVVGGLAVFVLIGSKPKLDKNGRPIESDSLIKERLKYQTQLGLARINAGVQNNHIRADYMSHQGDNSVKMKALTNDFTLKNKVIEYTKSFKTVQQEADNKFRLIWQQNETDLRRMNLNFNHDIGITNAWLGFGKGLFDGIAGLF